jgi:hypothetical protein
MWFPGLTCFDGPKTDTHAHTRARARASGCSCVQDKEQGSTKGMTPLSCTVQL